MNNPFTNAIRGLGSNVSGLLNGNNPLSQPQITNIFGFTVPGTPLISTRDFFLSQMESWFTAIPMRTQWMLLIQGYPQLLQTEVVHSLEDKVGNYNNFDINQAVSILKSYPLNKVIGCVFAQGINIPSAQKLSTSKNKIFNDKQRGFTPGQISEGRESFENLTIQFRETNTSFVDFVVRPWSMLSSHFGFVAREQSDLRDVSTTISILQFTRSYQKISQIPRKIWTFYNCFPVSVSNQNLTYDKEDMEVNSTEWTYSNYSIQNNLYLPLPDIINKISSSNFNRISPFQRGGF